MAHDMYNPGGGLNIFWVDEDIDRCAKREFEEYANVIGTHFQQSVQSIINNNVKEIYDKYAEYYNDDDDEDDDEEENDIGAELEAKFQFIKNHSDNPEDLELAKKILGID